MPKGSSETAGNRGPSMVLVVIPALPGTSWRGTAGLMDALNEADLLDAVAVSLACGWDQDRWF